VEPEQAVNLEPGWYKDPFFLDHERYWDGKWTDQLRHIESGRPSIQTNAAADAVAAATVTAAAPRVPGGPGVASYPAAAGLDTAIGAPERADPSNESTSLIHDDDTLVVAFPAEPRPDDTATIPATRPADLDTGVLPAVSPVGASGDAPTDRKDDRPVAPRSAQWEASRAAQEEAAAGRARDRRRRLAYAVGVLVLVVIAVVSVILVSGRGGTTNATTVVTAPPVSAAPAASQANAPTAAASLQAAANVSVTKKSVVTAVALVPANPSQSAPPQISGTGAFVLNVGLGPLSLSGSGASTETQRLLFQGTTVYVNVSDSPVPGKTWVVAGANNLPGIGSGSDVTSLVATMGNPGLLLHQLAATPISVPIRGTSSVGGTTVHVYVVSFTSGPTATLAAGYGSHSSEQVDVGPDGLVRQIVMPGPATTVDGQAVPRNIVVTFTRYGKPLVVATPPFGELISLSQYLTHPTPASSQSQTSGNS
jgi:hypothetical protein